MITAQTLMTRPPICISAMDSVGRASQVMFEMKVGSLVVLDDDRPVGIVTSRNLRGAPPNRLVADTMVGDLVSIPPNCSVWAAYEILLERGIERLIVVDGERAVGVLTAKSLGEFVSRHIDGLTGLPDRAYLMHQACEWMAAGKEICILFIDLDNFGQINKQLGHTYGDRLIREAASVLFQLCTRHDAVCRYGGDEFAVVTTRPHGEAEGLVSEIKASLARHTEAAGLRLTASIGLAGGQRSVQRSDDLDEVLENLINLASRASTEAKPTIRRLFVANDTGA